MTVALTIIRNLGSALLLPVFLAASFLALVAFLLSPLVGVASVLTIIFVVLRLVGVLDWSWLWVLAPVWIMVASALLMSFAPLAMRYTAPDFGRVKSDDPDILWTERHLNWTLVIGYLAIVGTGWYLETIISVLPPVGVLTASAIAIVGLWTMGVMLLVWYLKRKARSRWHLLWAIPLTLVPPLGALALFCLRNKRRAQVDSAYQRADEFRDDAKSIVINCGACFNLHRVTRGQGTIVTMCPNCGRAARIET